MAKGREAGYCQRQTRLQLNARMCIWVSEVCLSDRDLASGCGAGWVEISTLHAAAAAHDAVRWHVFCNNGTRGHD